MINSEDLLKTPAEFSTEPLAIFFGKKVFESLKINILYTVLYCYKLPEVSVYPKLKN